MKIVVIDGQGGKMGRTIVEQLRIELPECKITAIGTNSIATSAMLKAGADMGATGENPVICNCLDADIIMGSMATAIGNSKAIKILIPVNRCNLYVAGIKELSFNEYTRLAITQVKEIMAIKN